MIFRCVRLYTVRFLWIKDQNDICILFWIDKVVAWGSFHSNVLEFFVLAERFPNYISVIGRNGNTIQLRPWRMTYILTLLVISRGYLSSILRSISLFYNLRLSRIFCYLSAFGIWQFTNVIFVKKVSYVDSKKWPYLIGKTPYRHCITQFEYEYVWFMQFSIR